MTSLPRILAIMGSGETAPTMVGTHRRLASLLPSPVRAVVLDTPYGFQENASELASRAVEYFKTSVNVDLRVAGLTRMKQSNGLPSPSSAVVEKGLRAVDDAHYLFAGPGSPTYSMQQWSDTPIRALLARKLNQGGIITFASAAALTLGGRTVPVYEIYKVGMDPYWNEGLGLLRELGIPASVIPHYDNAEGGSHDTRFCYLGERRLQVLESMMPDDEYILGVDEHTGLVINLDDETAQVVGNSTVTLRKGSRKLVHAAGESFSIEELRAPSFVGAFAVTTSRAATLSSKRQDDSPASSSATGRSLLGSAESLRTSFDDALIRGDADAAVEAALSLESEIRAWAADTLQSDERDRAVAIFRAMISRLGEIAVNGLRDPRSVVAPFVDGLLAIRKVVKQEKRFDLSDVVRDSLLQAGVEVRDTKDGVEWVLKPQM
ncbi:MAG: hypothetical protein RL072_1335 [Actinomycetota bacterium]|jgi:hypothetical protein